MRPPLRLAALAATLAALGALPVPTAAATGTCTPSENRSRLGYPGIAARTSTQIITAVSPDVPKATVDGATAVSKITLSDPGTVRSLRVMNIGMAHTNLADVTLRLRSPGGAQVLLANALAGANLTSTSFTDAAPSIFVGLPPYSGTFAPQEWLAQLDGEAIAGEWRLEITDEAGTASGTLTSWTLEITPKSCAEQPLAAFTAGPNPVVPGGTVTFDGSASAGAGAAAVAKYEWDLDGDGSFETDTGTTPTTTRSYPVKGTFAIGLKVTDAGGDTDRRVRALAVTAAPVAVPSVNPGSPLSLVTTTLDASASSDPDGTIVRYEWDLDGDGTFEVDAGNTAAIQRLFGSSGPRQVGLRVTDDNGAVTSATTAVIVQNRPPSADFAATTPPAIVGAPAPMDAGDSLDLDGTIVDYEWDFDNDGSYERHGASPTVDHVFAASGTFTVGLRVTDNGGATDAVTREVVVTRAPVAALAASPQTTRPGVPVTFDPAGSADPDAGGSIVRYDWDFDGDGTVDRTTATGAPVVHAYAGFGLFTARLVVTDDEGAATNATFVVNVKNDAPVAALSIAPAAVLTGTPVTLSGSGSLDPDGSIEKYEWDLDGNGTFETNSGSSATIVRSFPNRMRVTVKLRVTDGDGASAVAAGALAVDPVAAPPSAGADRPGPGAGLAPFTASLSGASIQALRSVVRRGLGVRCRVDRGATCELELVVSARDARRLRLTTGPESRDPVRIAQARVTTTTRGSKAMALRLGARARRALGRSRERVVVIVQGTATDATGATATLRRAVMLR